MDLYSRIGRGKEKYMMLLEGSVYDQNEAEAGSASHDRS